MNRGRSLLLSLLTLLALVAGPAADAWAASAPSLVGLETGVGRSAPLTSALVGSHPLESGLTPRLAARGYDRIAVATGVAAEEGAGIGDLGLDAANEQELRATVSRIDSGGPHPYNQDATVFENREGLLPKEPSGYYKEYTVDTPGAVNRGAQRVVVGRGGEYYYTPDHYGSFQRFNPGS